MAIYEWNQEEIASIIKQLRREKESLEDNMTKLTKNKNIIFAAFEGDAATQFQSDLETDLSNLKTVIGMLELEINGLRNVNDKHYLGCEQSLHTLVNELNNSKV